MNPNSAPSSESAAPDAASRINSIMLNENLIMEGVLGSDSASGSTQGNPQQQQHKRQGSQGIEKAMAGLNMVCSNQFV